VATRREPITGTSEFPNIHEAEVTVLIPSPPNSSGEPDAPSSPLWGGDGGGGVSESRSGSGAGTPTPAPPQKGEGKEGAPAQEVSFHDLVGMAAGGATLAQLAGTAAGPAPVAVAPLPSTRLAEPFERLRDLSDAYLARTGSRPKVFLANLGPVAAFTARATFAKNFFEAGGIEAVTNEGFSDQDKLSRAYSESKAKLSCICSSDEIYETHAAETAETLKRAGSPLIFLAGRPGDREDELTRAGITTFIYAGCDALTVLSRALDEACA
jgi:methylmalonyl-CoA mutase